MMRLSDSFSHIDTKELSRKLGMSRERLSRDIFRLGRLIGSFDVRGKRVLEIGCGSGTYCLLMAFAGAEEVVGLEPEVDGSTSGSFEAFAGKVTRTGLTNIKMYKVTLEDYDLDANGPFDLVLTYNVVNHLNKGAVQRLHFDESAKEMYQGIFKRIHQSIHPGGVFVLADCSRHNIFSGTSRLGLYKGPLTRSIEWDKHQRPMVWKKLLRETGFEHFELEYWIPYVLRKVPFLANNRVFSYLTISHFTLRARKSQLSTDKIK